MLYKRADKKDAFLISEMSKFKCEQRAQLKQGTKLTAQAVDTVKGNIWLKVKVNSLECYIIAYDKKKDKCYIK